MAETSNTYITCYIKKGKVVEQFFLNSQYEATTMEALGRKKGYETETLVMVNDWLPSRSGTEVEATSYVSPKKQKRPWNKWIRCVETGQVFPTVRECSDQLGISYKSVWNAINSGNARDGYHFIFEEHRLEPWKNVEYYTGSPSPRQRKILCVTNGICYESVKDCLRDCHLPANSFYRALHKGVPVSGSGLLFRYVD